MTQVTWSTSGQLGGLSCIGRILLDKGYVIFLLSWCTVLSTWGGGHRAPCGPFPLPSFLAQRHAVAALGCCEFPWCQPLCMRPLVPPLFCLFPSLAAPSSSRQTSVCCRSPAKSDGAPSHHHPSLSTSLRLFLQLPCTTLTTLRLSLSPVVLLLLLLLATYGWLPLQGLGPWCRTGSRPMTGLGVARLTLQPTQQGMRPWAKVQAQRTPRWPLIPLAARCCTTLAACAAALTRAW